MRAILALALPAFGPQIWQQAHGRPESLPWRPLIGSSAPVTVDKKAKT
jgi:hypothetical protein